MVDSLDINIVVSVDKNFYGHLSVLINSAKYYTTQKICLYLCVADLETEIFFERELSKHISSNFSYEILLFKNTYFLNVFKDRVFDHPIECYFRLLFGELLPAHLKKILYLDADMIVNSDLSELYNYPLSTSIGGSVDRFGFIYCKKYLLQDLNIQITNYVNAGMLLIDLDKWRDKNITSKMISFLDKNFDKLKMLDQDLINIFFQNDITIIDSRWNHILFHGSFDENIHLRTGIYHLLGSIKGNTDFYPNYRLRKMYQFFNGDVITPLGDFKHLVLYVFLSYPIKSFLIFKSKIHYRHSKLHWFLFLNIFWIFYPPVLIIFFQQIFYQARRRGFFGFFARLKEFL